METQAVPALTTRVDKPYVDLREFLERVDALGELKRVSGAGWDLEMGCLAELIYHAGQENPPAILFDDIPGYPGFRCVSGLTNSSQRLAVTLGFPLSKNAIDIVQCYRDRMKEHKPIPPVEVDAKTAPIYQNVLRGDDIDILKFPVPKLHELDGGRYVGTDDLVIMKDPDGGWVNIGTYRSMVHDAKSLGLWISPGKQGRQIRDKYFAQGKPCPVLICVGHDPLLFLASGNELPYGLSEYDYAGGHRGLPFEVVRSEVHGLPMPAHAEIVIEGEMHPGDMRLEGPFGEFTGYYASHQSPQPVVRIQRIYHRDSPILTMASPMQPPSDFSFSKCVTKSGMIWDEIERAGLSGVKGVWCHEAGGARMFNIISIKQRYPGHARQALHLAASCQSASYLGRFVVVVDEDVDPTNTFDVIWAISTRCDPAEDIEFIRRAWSGPLDPMLTEGSGTNSRGLIDACRPFERLATFPPVARASDELRKAVAEKFKHLLT
jgi:UbiD family decarboxylase